MLSLDERTVDLTEPIDTAVNPPSVSAESQGSAAGTDAQAYERRQRIRARRVYDLGPVAPR